MTRKIKWIILGIVLSVMGLLLTVSVLAGPATEPFQLQEDGSVAAAVGTGFTYQGKLENGSGPVTANCSMDFRLYDDGGSGGNQVGSAIITTVPITDGLFTVNLDFGTVFTGTALWLEVAVQCPGDTGYTTLSPRQALTPAPYALALPGLWTQQNGTSPNLVGGFGGNGFDEGVVGATIGGGGSASYPNWVTGDFGTVGGGENNTAGINGTVGGGWGNQASGDDATIGGGAVNTADGCFATIGGGLYNVAVYCNSTVGGGKANAADAWAATIGGGITNTVEAGWATIGGGISNTVTIDAPEATIGGGFANVADATDATIGGGVYNTTSGEAATVAGGSNNIAGGEYTAVGGGWVNINNGNYSTIGGGTENTVEAPWATIGGGISNTITADASEATIGGGYANVADGLDTTIGGGIHNTASGDFATIPGGVNNTASGDYSFAAGAGADATHPGSFVWSSGEDTSSWYTNTFTARAHGGARFYSASGTGFGVELAAGGGSWGNLSDRNAKANFADVDPEQVLEVLAAMPIQTWNYNSQSPDMRHIGPVAQDFNGGFAYLFGEVESPTHINSMDAVGVALVSIQGLYNQNQELAAENATLQQQVDDLGARVAALESGSGNGSVPASYVSFLPWGAVLVVGGVAWMSRRRDARDISDGGGR